MEILNSDTLDKIISILNFKDTDAEKEEDQELKQFLKYIRLLDNHENEILKLIKSINPEELFYNRYYWFKRFKGRYFVLYGHDEGLEQQSYKMLEDYNTRFSDEIDWNIIKQIEQNTKPKP